MVTAALTHARTHRVLWTLFLVIIGVYLLVATVTYSPYDPGWSHLSSDTQQVTNATGVAGAWLADLLYGFWGRSALLLPLLVLIEAIQLWYPRSYVERPFRLAGEVFLLVIASALFGLHGMQVSDTMQNAAGGILGFELSQHLLGLMPSFVATAILLALFLVIFTFAFGVAWGKTLDAVGEIPLLLNELFYRNEPEPKPMTKVVQASEVIQPASVASSASITTSTESTHAAATSADAGINSSVPEPLPATANTFAEVMAAAVPAVAASAVHVEAVQTEPEPTVAPQPALPTLAIPSPKPLEEPIVVRRAPSINWEDDFFHRALDVIPDDEEEAAATPLSPMHVPVASVTAASVAAPVATASAHEIAAHDLAAHNASDYDTPVAHDIAPHAAFDHAHSDFQTDAWQAARQEAYKEAQPESDVLQSAAPQSGAAGWGARFGASSVQAEHLAHTEPHEHSAINEASPALEPQPALIQAQALQQAYQSQPIQPVAVQPIVQPAVAQAEQAPAVPVQDWDAPLTDAFGRPLSRAMQTVQHRANLSPLPGLELLERPDLTRRASYTPEQLSRLSELLEIKLKEFNVVARVIEAQPGPVVTRFELELAAGVKASKVTNIARDLARSLSMASVRVVEVIPGKPYIGIEVPNATREMVRLIELLETPAYRDPKGLISMAMGKDIAGRPVLTDLAKAPHMLVAGTTGSGKSVAINAMLLSMLMKYTPSQLRLILIDPKQLELSNYNDIPHLLTPVVTDMKDAASSLNWCVGEMERRYKLLAFMKVRNVEAYNQKITEAEARGEDMLDPLWRPEDSALQQRAPRLKTMPLIVVVADEFADMIMQVGKKAEELIQRLAQKSRAAGIHLILATQRPSVDVITGLIKANIPTRAALRVNSKVDSRTILDEGGAEYLLGHGDMLFLAPGKNEPERVHGAFISDDEVNRICDAWRERGSPDYVDEILDAYDEEAPSKGGGYDSSDSDVERDPVYDDVLAFIMETRKVSASAIQRKFSLGYNRAARIVDMMEEAGVVSPMQANGKREILI